MGKCTLCVASPDDTGFLLFLLLFVSRFDACICGAEMHLG